MAESRPDDTKILIVDDDDRVRAWLREVLEGAGHKVREAANGKEALDLLQHDTVDLFITDLVMPEQEGIETVRLLRYSYPDLKIITISGAFGPLFLRMTKVLGAKAALQKPIGVQKLLETVNEVLGR
jgi:CheY-like chemotaxis protein